MKITDDTVDSKIIPSIADLPSFVLQASRLKNLVAAVVQASHLEVVLAYHAIAKRFANSVPKDFALRALEGNDKAAKLMWTEHVKSQESGAVTQADFQK